MKPRTKILLYLIGAFCFHVLFWHEGTGINYLIFSMLVIGLLFLERAIAFSYRMVIFSSVLFVATGLVVLMHGALFSVVMFWCALLVMLGLVMGKGRFSSNLYALAASVSNMLYFLKGMVSTLNEINTVGHTPVRKVQKILKLAVWPMFFLVVFFFLYRGANNVFMKFSDSFFHKIERYLGSWSHNVSIGSMFFGLFALWVVGLILFDGIEEKTAQSCEPEENLSRTKIKERRSQHNILKGLTRGLESEKLTALMMFGMLNLLAGVVNLIDLKWLWMDYSGVSASQLSKFVHEGTYLLVLSVVLAGAIVLYFFRSNMNYMRKGGLLKKMTYLWLVQNMFMVLSVGIRNYYYIHEYGFAYKRLGVVFFLFAVLIGLLSLLYKVHSQKSFWYFVKLNAWSVFLVLVFTSWVNWDMLIVRYNIHSAQNRVVDANFLMTLSPKTYPYIEKHKSEILKRAGGVSEQGFDFKMSAKKEQFISNQQKYSWLSWSWADAKAIEQLGSR